LLFIPFRKGRFNNLNATFCSSILRDNLSDDSIGVIKEIERMVSTGFKKSRKQKGWIVMNY
jgi:hypothetical protein